jgi:hypothetical protein
MENIPVSGLLSPVSPTDNYPIIDSAFGIDGLRNLSSTQSMYDIPLGKRRQGMVVGVPINNTTGYFKLKPEGNGVTWSVGDVTNWDSFLVSPSASIPIKYEVINETIDIPSGYMYLVYGNLTIGATGVVNNFGKVVIINGNLVTASNGQFNTDSGQYITASFYVQKIVKTFSSVANVGITVSHNLNTTDFTYTLRDGYNFVYGNVEIVPSDPSNKVLVTCATAINYITMTIVG